MAAKLLWEGVRLALYGGAGFAGGRWFDEHVHITKSSNGKVNRYQMEVQLPASASAGERNDSIRSLPTLQSIEVDIDPAVSPDFEIDLRIPETSPETMKCKGKFGLLEESGENYLKTGILGARGGRGGGGRGESDDGANEKSEDKKPKQKYFTRLRSANEEAKAKGGRTAGAVDDEAAREAGAARVHARAAGAVDDEAPREAGAAAEPKDRTEEAEVWLDVDDIPRIHAEQMIIHEETEMPNPRKLGRGQTSKNAPTGC